MGTTWLYDIVNGYTEQYSLRDNQKYVIEKAQLSNQINGSYSPIKLNTISKRNHYNNDRVFSFLQKIESEVNHSLKSPKILLFNEKEYENNQGQSFVKIGGSRWDNFTLETGNIIGHLKYNDHQIHIGSRFGNLFLKYIIADADGFLEIDNLGGIKKRGAYNWLLQYYWIIKLKKAFRLGLPKVYEKQTKIEAKVRGEIDVVHFELNKSIGKYKSTSRNHSFFCDQNLLILEAFKEINNEFLSNDLFSIKQAFNVVGEGHRKTKAELLCVKPFKNPFYSDYNEVITLSKILLGKGSIDTGDNSNASGFLFDVSMLFEYFIRKLFLRNGFYVHAKNEHNYNIPTGTNYKRNLYPDLIASCEGRTFLFDVKYKRFDSRLGVHREDLFQIYTYLSQVGNTDNLDYFGFIYPTTDKAAKVLKKENVTVLGKEFTFLVGYLYIPQESQAFNEEFSESIATFINEIKNLNPR